MKKAAILTVLLVLSMGLAAAQDSDGDGVPDERDKCPETYGVDAYQGCEPPMERSGANDEVQVSVSRSPTNFLKLQWVKFTNFINFLEYRPPSGVDYIG